MTRELNQQLEKANRDRRRYFRRLEAIRGLATTKHEPLAQFVSRVRACLYQRNF